MVTYRRVAPAFFCRLSLSAGEVDETRSADGSPGPVTCSFSLTAARHG
jgi:hypothetical protein